MFDARMKKLADLLVGYSTKVQPGERVLIEAFDAPAEMVTLLVDRVAEAGGLPFAQTHSQRVLRSLYMNATEEQSKIYGKRDLEFMEQMQVYIGLRGASTSPKHRMCPTRSAAYIRSTGKSPSWTVAYRNRSGSC